MTQSLIQQDDIVQMPTEDASDYEVVLVLVGELRLRSLRSGLIKNVLDTEPILITVAQARAWN